MRFVVDECTGPKVAKWLRSLNHDVYSAFDDARGSDDDELLKLAFDDERILITNDKDFGEKIFREGKQHKGVVFLRLADERSVVKIRTLDLLLQQYAGELSGKFVVVTETKVRFARTL
ncbi:MAG: DUF5615 family PIN-like protein [Planctomycetes bacterium]|nr:DUF5615 family PIN-like protein [Planctomycetota bacterium]